jgi:hypothetical protein
MDLVNDQYKTFIPKQDPDLPNNYGVKFELRNGEVKVFEVVSHSYSQELRSWEVLTKEEELKVIPADVISEVSLDKRWIKVLEIRKKIANAKEGKNV